MNHFQSAATVAPWTPPSQRGSADLSRPVGERIVLSEEALEAEATKDRIAQMCGYILDEYFREDDLQAKALVSKLPFSHPASCQEYQTSLPGFELKPGENNQDIVVPSISVVIPSATIC